MSRKKPKLGHETLELGPLPTRLINKALELELEDGEVVLIPAIRLHVLRNHAAEYTRTLPHIAGVVASPQFVGDDFKNHGKIELVARVPALGEAVLVAVCIERNERGQYEVRSFYTVTEQKIRSRLGRGFLKRSPIC